MAAFMMPLPGDPGVIRGYASKFAETSDALTNATTQLTELFSLHDGTISKAISKLSETGDQVEKYITQAYIRYNTAADALQEYAGQLESTQNRAQAAISDYQYAEAQLNAAYFKHDHEQQLATQTDPTDPEYIDIQRKVQLAQNHIRQLQAIMVQAENEWDAASRDQHAAAEAAAGKIRDGDNLSQLNNNGLMDAIVSAWDGFMDWVRKNKDLVALIAAIAAGISKWAGYLSGIFALLALLPIPGVDALFAGLALAAGIIAIAASLIAFVGTLLLGLVGAATVTDVIFAGVDVALSVLTVLPGGAEAGTAVKTAAKAGEAAVKSAAETTSEKIVDHVIVEVVNSAGGTALNVEHEEMNGDEKGKPLTGWDVLAQVGKSIELPFTPPNMGPDTTAKIAEGFQSGDGFKVQGALQGFDVNNSMVVGAVNDIGGDVSRGWNDFSQGIAVSLMGVTS